MSELTVHTFGRDDAPTMILVHGLSDDGTAWPDAVERWGRHWRLLAVDQRGHGASPRFRPDELSRTAEILEDDLVAVLEEQDSPVVLVGHSLGGLMAARAALRVPEKVRALVLEDPAKPRPGEDTEFLPFVESVVANPGAAIARQAAESTWSGPELLAWAKSKERVDLGYLAGGLTLGRMGWETGLFDRLTTPTLVLVPVDGPMAPDPDLIPGDLVRVTEVPGAGHCVRRDRPEAYYAAVEGFLAGL
ncbi:alpha/beta fold hydrolase [Tessaracoccus palaemonis]|uniref:Alpha/beta hydrolase n=1 Tax=Tessaracoccus palaemonis TaxID=2829499 RepID=A0ABX8SMG4_9ACTN|nr:alpha/beta hydrolase [Tessaracoccus palaemonis]QXT63820.1 alpha/beta hydrolase [Tessaracoccus palaemonis]